MEKLYAIRDAFFWWAGVWASVTLGNHAICTALKRRRREKREHEYLQFSEQEFLAALKDQRIPCVIITSNGFQMQGATVLAIDSDKNALLVEYSGARQMVYQHSVSTIRPLRPVRLETVDREGGGTDG